MPAGLISSPVGGEGGACSRPTPPPQRCVSPAGSRKIQPLARRALLLYDDDDDDDILQDNFPVRLSFLFCKLWYCSHIIFAVFLLLLLLFLFVVVAAVVLIAAVVVIFVNSALPPQS